MTKNLRKTGHFFSAAIPHNDYKIKNKGGIKE